MSASMFKAVVWKELRENLKYAVVALLGMTAVLAFANPSLDEPLRGRGVDLSGIFTILDVTTTIGGLLAGLLIGVAQTVVENRGDKWGFLAHRPISRTTLFWGKATAGILLYAISTGLPVAVTVFRVASPGYLPIPFDWRFALPAIANLLCGLVFYFAGSLAGMRQARWYASRALGIGAAICVLVVQLVVAVEFWHAVAASAVGLIMVGTAAWSTFVAGGQYGAQPRIGRIATGVSIGLGMTLVAWLVLVNALPGYEAPRETRYTTYSVTTDGVVARVTRDSIQIVEVSDPGGRPLEQYRNLAPGQRLSADVVSVTLSPRKWALPPFRSGGRLFSPLRRADAANPVGWYYVHRVGLFAAYDSEAQKVIGWMGPDGFSQRDMKPRPFAGRLIRMSSSDVGQILLVFEGAVYRMDPNNRRVELAFQSEPGETILDAGSSPRIASRSTLADFGEMGQFEVVSTTRRVIVQLRDGTRLLDAPQDAQASKYPVLVVSRAMRAPGVPTFLRYQSNPGEESRISEFNSAGAVVNSWTLPDTNGVWKESPLRIAITSATFPSSAIFPLFSQPSFRILRPMQRLESSLTRPPETARWAVAILSALVSAAAVFLHGRRYAFPSGRLCTWVGIALLLGPLGYLLMLALIEWPARESCPACSRKRVVTRVSCEHCGKPFAPPEEDGTEIFEPMPARPQ